MQTRGKVRELRLASRLSSVAFLQSFRTVIPERVVDYRLTSRKVSSESRMSDADPRTTREFTRSPLVATGACTSKTS
jgi:hypothetical protein